MKAATTYGPPRRAVWILSALAGAAAWAGVRWLRQRPPQPQPPHPVARPEQDADVQQDSMQRHMAQMHAMRLRMLWTQYAVIALGAWLMSSPLQFGLFDAGTAGTVRDLSGERNLWPAALRNALCGWSDLVSGALLILFGALALSERFKLAQWGTCIVGLWLLFAPILFWAPEAAVYANDTAVGTLAIMLSVLVSMMPGMSHQGMMDDSDLPPGWTYNPSSWPQRLPIIALGFFGFLLARYLAAYQLGHVTTVWDPVFSGRENLNGTEDIITSWVSRAFPVSDAAFGGLAYMLEMLMGAMGSGKRWRTMPWMVTFFFILVVPLGAVSIGFIVIQPIMIGTYCTLCLVQAFAMLVMIPLAIDEVVAMGQYMRRSVAAGRPFWATFIHGGPDDAAGRDEATPALDAPAVRQVAAGIWGVSMSLPLLAAAALGIWLMVSRLLFGTDGALADSDHLVGAMILTVAVIALAEVARALRALIVPLGLWLIASPWLLADGLASAGSWNSIACGLLVILLAIPLGHRSGHRYGNWERWIR